ncbi:hypothetical protein HRV97_00795 [Sphingomonas sp. HHU CXW]|uniref:Uncharacterized protein n=1 Tax=Sphingomonas hominis TaxID=2741495 RepID=A0ABX2JDR6_9SPHN|nr:hypothetical protein [Sphingomonas hominis]NTS63694.1 hypothetical protein [Sphingomonas hominis]
MRRAPALRVIAALALATASVIVQRDDASVAIYGTEGGLSQVHPRVEGGWPAAFVADDPATSVPYRLGVEDVFRPAPFVADVAFWYLAVGLLLWLARRAAASVSPRP